VEFIWLRECHLHAFNCTHKTTAPLWKETGFKVVRKWADKECSLLTTIPSIVKDYNTVTLNTVYWPQNCTPRRAPKQADEDSAAHKVRVSTLQSSVRRPRRTPSTCSPPDESGSSPGNFRTAPTRQRSHEMDSGFGFHSHCPLRNYEWFVGTGIFHISTVDSE
jgi:hypothetical protein